MKTWEIAQQLSAREVPCRDEQTGAMIERQVQTNFSQNSRLVIGHEALQQLAIELRKDCDRGTKVAIVTDRNVAAYWLDAVQDALNEARFATKVIRIPAGEESKSLQMLGNVWDQLLEFGFERGSVIVALGGGVVGDLAGFAASTILRGVRVVQVPTSLLAQVDSSVGGKTGINRSYGKNLVGTFWQPSLVLVDPQALSTLDDREFRCGLAEVAKYGMIRDPVILDTLRSFPNLTALRDDPNALQDLIVRCINIKVEIVNADAREGNQRAILNYGHTVGHAIESAEEYRGLTHGEAVGVGMVAASFLAVDLQEANASLPAEISEVLVRYDLPVTTSIAPKDLLPRLQRDKKRVANQSRWILVTEPGRTKIVTEPAMDAVLRALEAIHQSLESSPEA